MFTGIERDITAGFEEVKKMIDSMVTYNGRDIPEEDRVFAASGRARAAAESRGRDAVINATVGALYDDSGELVVMKTVDRELHRLSARDFAEYAPIAGVPGFRKAVIRAALGNYEAKSFVEAVATPGGTASISNAVANYSCPGDRILTHSWHWGPYRSIAENQGRSLEYFTMFDEQGRFNTADFDYKVKKLLRNQEHLLIIINTPANNPTGYSLSMEDWRAVRETLDEVAMDKRVTLVADAAYIDFAGEPEETREFLSVLDNLRANILPIIAYSASKTFTMYGFRCAAMVCLAHSPEVAAEFVRACSYTARALWSNSPRAPQTVIERIYADPELLKETDEERAVYRNMLLERGKAFDEAAAACGLKILPFRAGFFVTIPYTDPDSLCAALEAKDIYPIPVGGGIRISVASVTAEKCSRLPSVIKAAMDSIQN